MAVEAGLRVHQASMPPNTSGISHPSTRTGGAAAAAAFRAIAERSPPISIFADFASPIWPSLPASRLHTEKHAS